MRGVRKFVMGMAYLVGAFLAIETSIVMEQGAGVIAAVASAVVAIAPGLGVIIYGNVKNAEAYLKNGNGNGAQA